MNGQSTGWRNYLPTLAILALLATAFVISLRSQVSAQPGIPALTGFRYTMLLVIGLAAGFLGGIIGTGGCSVMLPAIHFWLGYPSAVAVGTTLFAVIFTAISGGYAHLVRRNLDTRATLWLGGSGIIGVLLGSYLFTLLSSQTRLLGLLLGLAFLWPAIRMIGDGLFIRHKKIRREGNEIPGSSSGLAAFGFVIGTLTGLVGLGGGYALVPGLIYLFGAPVYVTMGTSLATMIPLAVVGGSIKLAQGFVAVNSGLILAAGTVIGAQIGASAIKRFKPNTLKLIFGLYFAYVSIRFIAGYFGVHVW
jgi:hypothetical protein